MRPATQYSEEPEFSKASLDDMVECIIDLRKALGDARAETTEMRKRITDTAGDFAPDRDADAPQALAEMRDALLALAEPRS
jgi:hypothetical protein